MNSLTYDDYELGKDKITIFLYKNNFIKMEKNTLMNTKSLTLGLILVFIYPTVFYFSLMIDLRPEFLCFVSIVNLNQYPRIMNYLSDKYF